MNSLHKLTFIFSALAAIGLTWLAWPLDNAATWVLIIWVIMGIPAVHSILELE